MYKILYKKNNFNSTIEEDYLHVLPKDVIKHIERMSNRNRKCMSIHTWLLLNKLCNEIYNCDLSKFTFTYNENGKPIFEEFFVSLAHTNEFACVGIANYPIGIDMEVIRPLKNIRMKIGLCQDETISDEEFFVRFTQEEALVKKKGGFLGFPKGRLDKLKDNVDSIIVKLENQRVILSYTPNEKEVEIQYEN